MAPSSASVVAEVPPASYTEDVFENVGSNENPMLSSHRGSEVLGLPISPYDASSFYSSRGQQYAGSFPQVEVVAGLDMSMADSTHSMQPVENQPSGLYNGYNLPSQSQSQVTMSSALLRQHSTHSNAMSLVDGHSNTLFPPTLQMQQSMLSDPPGQGERCKALLSQLTEIVTQLTSGRDRSRNEAVPSISSVEQQQKNVSLSERLIKLSKWVDPSGAENSQTAGSSRMRGTSTSCSDDICDDLVLDANPFRR